MSMSNKVECYILADNSTKHTAHNLVQALESNQTAFSTHANNRIKEFASDSFLTGGPFPDLSKTDCCILIVDTVSTRRRFERHMDNIEKMLTKLRTDNPNAALFIVGTLCDDVESSTSPERRKISRAQCEDYAERYGAIAYIECNPSHWESPYAQNNQTTHAMWEQVQEVAEFLKLRAEIEAEKQQLSSLQQQKSRAEQDYKSARTKQAKQVRVLEETRNQVVRDVVRGKKPISSASHQAQPKKKKSGWSFLGKKNKSSRKTDETSANRPVIKV